MVTFTGIGCGGADSFLGGVSMVDIRGRAFLSDFRIQARLGLAEPEGLPAALLWWWKAAAVARRSVGDRFDAADRDAEFVAVFDDVVDVVEVDAEVLLDVVLDLVGVVAVDLEAAGDGVGDLDPRLIWVQVEARQERVEYVPAELVGT